MKLVVEIKMWDLARLIFRDKEAARKLVKILSKLEVGDRIQFYHEEDKRDLRELGRWRLLEK